MSNQPHAGANHRRRRQTTTRRQFLAALSAGALGGAACYAYNGTPSEPRGREALTRDHEVRVDDRMTKVQTAVPKAYYQRVTDAEHSFSATFTAARDRPYLTSVTAALAKRAGDDAGATLAAQSLAAGITYETDEASTGEFEFVRYPAETLVHECGDCEDKAILLAGLLSRPPLDYRTALLVVPHHCATLVARSDLPRTLLAVDPVSVTLGGTEYVYVEAVEALQPGQAALDYGDRPHVAAYDGNWTVLNADALFEWGRKAFSRRGFGLVTGLLG